MDQDWDEKINDELAHVPVELRNPIYALAYEYGHANGKAEVFNYVSDMVWMLDDFLRDYRTRIQSELLDNGMLMVELSDPDY